ncbi:hypothetical protein EGW08_005485 [Elysia chlorotica]|uniref:Translocon-associated protein subunit beta n=1 Tax=Elysia chlorotica TaxID=188477 RepID=A0A3S1BM33_ELYCH|nr:hypothetical protein EGW08_005485 [Elysia chlorotica]
MKLWWAALVLTCGCFLPTFGDEDSDARLLVSKNILNQYLVEGKDLTVEYKVFNVGSKNSNATHAVILKPLKSGYFNFTSAEVSYLTSEDSKERTLDWLVFAFMTLPSLGIPYLLWFSSKSRYDQPKPKKN